LITLIIYKAGKRGLKYDLGVIAFLQSAALVYGVMVDRTGPPDLFGGSSLTGSRRWPRTRSIRPN
jgi:hypothetical protein